MWYFKVHNFSECINYHLVNYSKLVLLPIQTSWALPEKIPTKKNEKDIIWNLQKTQNFFLFCYYFSLLCFKLLRIPSQLIFWFCRLENWCLRNYESTLLLTWYTSPFDFYTVQLQLHLEDHLKCKNKTNMSLQTSIIFFILTRKTKSSRIYFYQALERIRGPTKKEALSWRIVPVTTHSWGYQGRLLQFKMKYLDARFLCRISSNKLLFFYIILLGELRNF